MGLIESIQDALPEGYANAILWLALALLALVVILVLIRLIRGFSGGTFVAGGRNRRTRLAVMDAAAVDSRRRLVLVRRDDVEHLVLIGGPTDVVIERDIRIMSRPARHAEHHDEAISAPPHSSPELERARAQIRPAPHPVSRPAEAPRPVEPVLPPRPAAPASNVTLPRPTIPMPAPPPPPGTAKPATPVASPRSYEPSRPTSSAAPSRLPPAKSLDDTLLNELSLSLEQTTSGSKSPSPKKPDTSLDEQMNKLLGEITKKA